MTQRFKPEPPPWQPKIEQPGPFHTGVPPRELIGEVLDAPEELDDGLDGEDGEDVDREDKLPR